MPNRTCIITGASRGIGLATALRLARGGWNIVAAARNAAALEQAAAQILATGAACEPVIGDVSEAPAAAHLIEAAVARFGRIDLLVNNASYAVLKSLENTAVAEFDRIVAVNINAVFHTVRAAWPIMRAQRGGVIVNISSMASIDPFTGLSVYGGCKAWVNTFTRAIAAEGKPHGIRVFAVAPGAVETQMLRSMFPNMPAERTLLPDEVAGVIESLADDRMNPATGETIFARK
jgi:NAD(P)-dependent dehydrogenase (short-subunit alcohol dehydrogenase family)